jgi:maltose/moltooligosaccharide transporter
VSASATQIEKPRLSFWQIWNMSFGFLGIQFGWTLQMNNMSAIYEYLGARPSQLPILWLAAPLTGLIVQPIIGYWSDNTWGRLGRRRPFFLAGALLSSCALTLMPLSGTLWMAAGLLWILDASINISMEPFRAFVADMLPDEQRARGFTMQSFFIGLGSVAASYSPLLLRRSFGFSSAAGAKAIPEIVRVAFWLGAAAFFAAVLFTILTTKEYPPAPHELQRLKTAKKFDLAEILHSLANNLPLFQRGGRPQRLWSDFHQGSRLHGWRDLGRLLLRGVQRCVLYRRAAAAITCQPPRSARHSFPLPPSRRGGAHLHRANPQ